MIFNGLRNQSLDFKIIDYEIPENFGPSCESNYLYIELKIKSEFGNWFTDGCAISTTDIEKIINWFFLLKQNKPVVSLLNFKEKGISFELLKSSHTIKQIRILFYSECTPENQNHIKPYYIDLEQNNMGLNDIYESLQKELNAFPTRGFEEKD